MIFLPLPVSFALEECLIELWQVWGLVGYAFWSEYKYWKEQQEKKQRKITGSAETAVTE